MPAVMLQYVRRTNAEYSSLKLGRRHTLQNARADLAKIKETRELYRALLDL